MSLMSEKDDNQWCFACGPKNPIGLKLVFQEEGDKYITQFTPGPEHQGYDGIVHGGIISTLLDEVMARYPYAKGLNTVTGRLEIRFRQATRVGQNLTITGWVTKQRGTMLELAGEVTLADGTVLAEGKATVVDVGAAGL
jgi:acyl-coenzyme A thioesterase PaaI-like protein